MPFTPASKFACFSLKINILMGRCARLPSDLSMKFRIFECQYPKNGKKSNLSCILNDFRKSPLPPPRYPFPMDVTLVSISAPPAAADPFCELTGMYLKRSSRFAKCHEQSFRTESAMFQWIARGKSRPAPSIVLLDSRGRSFTSEAFAAWIGGRRDAGTQHLIFAVGPANGWSDSSLEQAYLLISLGPMTMAHALAKLVFAEQLYRAFTILSGHPYHTGH